MPHLTPLPDILPTEFTYAQGRAFGVSPRRLRGSDLRTPHRGVRVLPETEPTENDSGPGSIDRDLRRRMMKRIAAYECVRHPNAFYVGRTALGIYRLPFLHDDAENLQVGVLLPARAPRVNGVTGRALSPWLAELVQHGGLPATNPASTWAYLARDFGERQLTMLADAIVRVPRGEGGRRRPDEQLATLDELRAAALSPHRRYREKLLRALDRARAGSMSVLESEYRLAAEDARLPEPELDVEIRDNRGRLVGIADVVYREQRTLVEIEGDRHRVSRAQWNRDLEKHADYAALGWKVVRVTSAHIRASDHAIEVVRAALARRVV